MSMDALRQRTTTALAGTALVLTVAACSGASAIRSSATAETDPAPSVTAPATAPPTAVGEAPSSTLAADVFGNGDYPGYAVEARGSWFSNGKFILRSDSVSGISVWDVTEIPRDPCHWKDSLEDPGDSVDEVVDALTAQATRQASTPKDVTLAGYKGRYLEWSVPIDAVVTGDADFAGCDLWPDNGHRDFVSWLSGSHGERYQQMAGQVDRLWILDVDGQTLVVDATHEAGQTTADLDEQSRIVESLRFVRP